MAGPTTLDAAATRAWVDAFVAELTARREALGDLDRRSGDGDYGNNLKTALDKIESALATADPALPGAPFTAVSTAFLGTGGTSGPLYGMWFRSLGQRCGIYPDPCGSGSSPIRSFTALRNLCLHPK